MIPSPGTLVTSSQKAAELVVTLMSEVNALLPPADLCANFAANRSTQKLFDAFGVKAVKAIAMGVRTLAVIWASAWRQGKGETKVPVAALKIISKAKLKSLYEDRDKFVPSVHLDEIAAILNANGGL